MIELIVKKYEANATGAYGFDVLLRIHSIKHDKTNYKSKKQNI